MRRLLALGMAVALVAIAIVIRGRIDNGNGGNSGGAKLRLVCTPELETVCDKLGSNVDVKVEEPGATADKLESAGGDLGLDGWMTPGPWPEIVRAARQRAGKEPLFGTDVSLASSRIGLAVWPDRLGVLRAFCPNSEVGWHCLGDAAARRDWSALNGPPVWGPVKFALPDPSTNATGLAALGAATAGYFGRYDLSSTDLDDGGFRAWLRALATSNADHPSLEDVLARGPAEAAAAATLEALGKPAVASTARSSKPTLAYPAPVASADVVLGSASTDRGRRLVALVAGNGHAALIADGWDPTTIPSRLPSAGLLDALRSAWKDAAG